MLRIAETRDIGGGITVTISAYQQLINGNRYYPGVRVTAWRYYGSDWWHYDPETNPNCETVLASEDIEATLQLNPDASHGDERKAYRFSRPTQEQIEAVVGRVVAKARKVPAV